MSLVSVLRAALPESLRDRVGDGLEDALAAFCRSAREPWPAWQLSDEELVAHVATRLSEDQDPAEALEHLFAPDLYLALGCLRGAPDAVTAFDAIVVREVGLAMARLKVPGADLDDIRQQLRLRLLVGDGDQGPRLAEYGGRGELRAWVRVIAVRDALQIRRKLGRETELPSDDGLAEASSTDPELARVQALYRDEFRKAILDALQGLESRARNMLRQHYLAQLSIDEIGAAFGVHRATAARWIARAREELVASARQKLRERLGISDGELESLMGIMQSQIEITLGGALASTPRV